MAHVGRGAERGGVTLFARVLDAVTAALRGAIRAARGVRRVGIGPAKITLLQRWVVQAVSAGMHGADTVHCVVVGRAFTRGKLTVGQ